MTHRWDERTYTSWYFMKHRCDNPQSGSYSRYGALGITYCSRWKNYRNFVKDMGYRPEGKTLDRIDNSKNYSPKNCRWATIKEQANNTRRNRWFTIGGKRKTLAQWTEISGLKPSTVRMRFYAYGWTIEKALGIGG